MLKRPKKYLQLCVVTLGFGWSFGTYAQNLSSPVVDVPPPPVRNEPLSNKKTDPAETYNMGDPDPLYPGGAQPGSGVSVGASPGTEEIPPLDINQTTPPPELTSESSSAERTTIPSTPPVESEPTVPMEFMTEAPPPAPPEAPAQQPVAEVKSKKKKKKTARMKVSPTAPENPDDPDSGLEGRLHQVFKNYNSSPTPNESWDKASASRASETYQIQKNDTLWDISTTLFGDPSYWPKVWALNNPLITNPHLIAPGQAVKFYPGTAAQPPTVEVAPVGATNPDGTPVAPEGGTPPAEGEGAPPPVLAQVGEGIPDGAWPPPKKPVVPLITSFPKSIPVWEMASKVKMDRIKIDLKPRNIKTPMMPLGYYVTNSSLEGVGEVEEMENGLKTAGEYQYIYVKIEGAASQGDRYYIADSLGKIATGFFSRSPYLIQLQGEIEIINVVNSSKSVYRALVKQSLHPIAIGSQLFTGSMPTYNPGASGAPQDFDARIIGGENNVVRNLLSAGALVFLNEGSAKGLATGAMLNIYADQSDRNPSTILKQNDRRVGLLKVIRVEEHFSTAVVLESSDEIHVGDKTIRDAATGSFEAGDMSDSFDSKGVEAAPTDTKDEFSEDDLREESLDLDADSAPAPSDESQNRLEDELNESSDGLDLEE